MVKKNKVETEVTIRKLLEVARRHFTEQGYADATLEEIVSEASLTRGALYHHFGNKKGLFHVVVEAVQQEIAERIETEAAKSNDVWEQLLLGCRAFVVAAVKPESKRILLLDGPAVLGWETWRLMDEQNSMRLLRSQLQFMKQQGELKQISIEAMTHLLSGALNEAALWIAQAPDDNQALEETMEAISYLLQGLKR